MTSALETPTAGAPSVLPEARTQQQLGAYYTPPEVAQAITDWAVRHRENRVLDPSYGGCAFLCASLQALRKVGKRECGSRIFGVDIDPNALGYLSPLLEAGAKTKQFLKSNFLNIEPHENFREFDCILGNPPYINYHDIDRRELELALKKMANQGFSICARASYWAYFVLHSLRFLKHGGRMGMLLPISFARADYAQEVRHILSKSFDKIHVVFLHERVFTDTDEQALILLCENKHQQIKETDDRNIAVFQAESKKDLIDSLASPQLLDAREKLLSPQDNLYKGLISEAAASLYEVAQQSPVTTRLGDWVETRIGVVTGSNSFFIASASQIAKRDLDRSCFSPIVRRPKEMKGLNFTRKDALTLESEDKECLLLSLNAEDELSPSMQKYIEGVPDEVKNAAKCKERSPWFCVKHRYAPQAFIHCMSSDWPRIVFNSSQATCTNNIYRLAWKHNRPQNDWLRLSLGSLSTLFQFSAEWSGRSYGSGVLKLEPREVRDLCVPLGGIFNPALAKSVDRMIRKGEMERATEIVDAQVLLNSLHFTPQDVDTLREARGVLQVRRQSREAKKV